MMRVTYILICLILILSCTSEPELHRYKVAILNEVNEPLFIEAYYQGTLKDELSLKKDESGLDCSYSNEYFTGYKSNLNSGCLIDSIVLKFNNNDFGYISSINYSSPYDFVENGVLFGSSDKFDKVADVYLFKITQQDFENAHVLP